MGLKWGQRSRTNVRSSIAIQEQKIKINMQIFSNLFDEFSMEWLLGVEANYKSFLNYCVCSIKKHEDNKKSK